VQPDEGIEASMKQTGVRVLSGADNLVEWLVELVDTCNFFYSPTSEEVELVIPGWDPRMDM
jgi:hypothetical protein